MDMHHANRATPDPYTGGGDGTDRMCGHRWDAHGVVNAGMEEQIVLCPDGRWPISPSRLEEIVGNPLRERTGL